MHIEVHNTMKACKGVLKMSIDGKATAENIIPTSTGAAKALGEVLPRLEGRLNGIAMRVPVPDGSIIDLACRLRERPDAGGVREAMRKAAGGPLRGILEYSEVPLVSTDIIGNPHGTEFLERDARNMCDWFARRGLEVDHGELFGDLIAAATSRW